METNSGGRDAGRADLPWKLPSWNGNSVVSIWPSSGPALGNFLSGMETKRDILKVKMSIFLGNFLSGMETGGLPMQSYVNLPPWKLP